MSDRELLRLIREAAHRLHLTDIELAALAGISEPIARGVRRDGRLPKSARCLRGLSVFAQRAAVVRSRTELGLP